MLKIYETKGRPRFNPLIVHVADLAMAGRYVTFSPMARKLAEAFWPGPLTLVLPMRPDAGLSDIVTAGLGTVGVRVPDHPLALELIREAVRKDVPAIGHCLGGQLMSKAFGGTVSANPVKEIGWGEVRVSDNSIAREWLGDLQAFDAFHWHGETFTIPRGVFPETGARVMDLQEPDKKMSTTGGTEQGTVLMLDSPDVIRKKIKTAVTDSGRDVVHAADKAGISNLIEIMTVATGESIAEVEARYDGQGYGAFKADVAESVIELLRPFQERFHELRSDPGELQRILQVGAAKAAECQENWPAVESNRRPVMKSPLRK